MEHKSIAEAHEYGRSSRIQQKLTPRAEAREYSRGSRIRQKLTPRAEASATSRGSLGRSPWNNRPGSQPKTRISFRPSKVQTPVRSVLEKRCFLLRGPCAPSRPWWCCCAPARPRWAPSSSPSCSGPRPLSAQGPSPPRPGTQGEAYWRELLLYSRASTIGVSFCYWRELLLYS